MAANCALQNYVELFRTLESYKITRRHAAKTSYVRHASTVRLELGTPILHPSRGHGRVTAIRPDQKKRFCVTFDNGEVHAYSAESAQKFKVQRNVKSGPAPVAKAAPNVTHAEPQVCPGLMPSRTVHVARRGADRLSQLLA